MEQSERKKGLCPGKSVKGVVVEPFRGERKSIGVRREGRKRKVRQE
jgi:hypothetical protein